MEPVRIIKAEQPIFSRDSGELVGPDSPGLSHLREFPGKVKGALITSVLEYYQMHHPDFLPRLKNDLCPEYRTQVEEDILPSSWYPEILFAAILKVSLRQIPFGTVEHEVNDAQEIFAHMSRSYHRMFARVVGPTKLISGFFRLWRLYHTIGKALVDEKSRFSTTARLTENPAVLVPRYTEGAIGAICGALAIAGAKNIQISYRRVPPDTVAFEGQWER